MKNNIVSLDLVKKWIVRTIAIFISTLAVIDLLEQNYELSFMLGLAWMLIALAEQRMKTNSSQSK